jgi:hypothetical protein
MTNDVPEVTKKKSRPKFDLRRLPYSPSNNPFCDGFEMRTKAKQIRTGGLQSMASTETGEIHTAVIIEEQELDDVHFVKVFTAGIRAAFALTLTGSRVFQAILEVYQTQPMSGGFADSIYLHFFDGGLDGRKLDIEDRTFRRGLIELLEKGFLYPRGQNLYWVNQNLFFRGNRATFVKSYRRKMNNNDQLPIRDMNVLYPNTHVANDDTEPKE